MGFSLVSVSESFDVNELKLRSTSTVRGGSIGPVQVHFGGQPEARVS